VSVTARLLTEPSFNSKRKRPGDRAATIESRWFPLVGSTGKLAVLVETSDPGAVPADSSVSGVLRRMPPKLREVVLAQQGAFAGLKINTDYVLVHGSTPPAGRSGERSRALRRCLR
jgi:hypothetical protein